MKNLKVLLTAGLLACVMSCAVGTLDEAVTESGFVFTANLAPESKVILGEDGKTPYWEVGDEITVFPAGEAGESVKGVVFKADLKGAATALSAEFRCPAEQLPENFEEAKPYIAVYGDLSDDAVREGDVIKGITIPEQQEALAGSYAKVSAPIIAKSETTDLYFNNLAAVVKFRVDAHCVNSVTFTSANVAGRLNSVLEPIQMSETVTLQGELEPDKDYYLAIAPGDRDHFSVAVNGQVVKTYDKEGTPVHFSSNMITNLGVFSPEVVLIGGTTTSEKTFAFDENEKYYVIKGMKIPPFGVETNRSAYPFKVKSGKRTFGSKFSLNRWNRLNEDTPYTTYNPMECAEPVQNSYDLYVAKDLKKIYIEKTGGQGPDTKHLETPLTIHIYTQNTYLFDSGDNPTIYLNVEGDDRSEEQQFQLTKENLKNDVVQPYRHWVLSGSSLKTKDLGRRVQVWFNEDKHISSNSMPKYLLDERMFFVPENTTSRDTKFEKREVPKAFPMV